MDVQVDFTLNSTDGTSTRFFTDGVLETKDGIKHLSFIEQTDAMLDTVVDIYTDKVILTRSGKFFMQMELNPFRETTVHMKAQKKFEVTMLNRTLNLFLDEDKLDAIYQTEMDKDKGVHHQLLISFKPKEKKE